MGGGAGESEREGGRETERERQSGREATETERQRDREAERNREREGERRKQGERSSHKESERASILLDPTGARVGQIANLYAAGLLLLVVLLALNYMTWRHYDHTIYAVRPASLHPPGFASARFSAQMRVCSSKVLAFSALSDGGRAQRSRCEQGVFVFSAEGPSVGVLSVQRGTNSSWSERRRRRKESSLLATYSSESSLSS